jgi:hypothetical protein
MLSKSWHKVFTMVILVLISFILFNIQPVIPSICLYEVSNIKTFDTIDPKMKNIYVPPAQNSHSKYFPQTGRLKYPNTWNNIDSNIPGLLPGPRIGDQLGLENNPILSLSSPIRAPLLDNIFPKCNSESNYMNKIKNNLLNDCLLTSEEKSNFLTLPASLYYKYRFQQCNPYNGSYCQCTNNYIPLPPVGYCQANGWNEDVCPYKYRVKPSYMYSNTQKCLEKHF